MSGRKIWIFGLLLLGLVLVPSVFATPSTVIDDGWWGNARFEGDNVLFDFISTEMVGTSTQPAVTPGRVAIGTFIGTVAGQDVECEYNLATFPDNGIGANQGISHFSMNRCTGGINLHMVGTAYLTDPTGFTGTWEARFHFDP